MGKYQLPPLKDEKTFEEFVCDVFNEIEKTDSYFNTQIFGVKGQNQKGIDIISPKSGTVIQCKKKDLRKSNTTIQKELISDFKNDLLKAKELNFKVLKFILVSTFRDDAKIQEYAATLNGNEVNFDCFYVGWDTLSKYAEESESIMKNYFPKFRQKRPKARQIELPENALGKYLNEKNYVRYLIKRYGDWKQLELKDKNQNFNWGSFQKGLMNKYRASGINHINIDYFISICEYLQKRIDGTKMGRINKGKGIKNYSTFEEQLEELNSLNASKE